nr:RRXRR domain-containing protein [Candidatus Freyarchaeota archaeon]
MQNVRVAVVGKDGEPRMPTKASRARRWIKQGKAVLKWSKLGVFYVKLTVEAGDRKQSIVLGLDPGSRFDGVAVVSKEKVLQTGMLELPKGVAKKMEQRRNMRSLRRYRKCRRRPCRFDNRRRLDGWIAPSQKSKVDFLLKVIEELGKIYPINKAVAEDVKFDHYRKRWGRFFSTVEIEKTRVHKMLDLWFHVLKLVSGEDTAELQYQYNAKKCSDKGKRVVESHALDALVISADEVGLSELVVPSFYVWKRYQHPQRQLYKFQFAKGGKRRRESGSRSLNGFRKGDVVMWKDVLARVGGFRNGLISLHSFDVDNKRFTQRAKPNDCIRLFNQRIMSTAIPLASKESEIH